jgi:hypothetical protein
VKKFALFALLFALTGPAMAATKTWQDALAEQTAGIKKAMSMQKAACVANEVGYRPARYAGLQDCWPGGSILQPDAAFLTCYVARYGQMPGNPAFGSDPPKWIPGYTNELGFVSRAVIENAGNASAAGPDGVALHPGCPAWTEIVDTSFTVPKGSPYVFQWYVSLQPGGTTANPEIEHEAARACGPRTVPRAMLNWWTQHFRNDPPCGSAPPPPVTCPNGSRDPGETCETCPQDIGPCPPPPPVFVYCPRPDEALLAKIQAAKTYVLNSLMRAGRKRETVKVLDEFRDAAVYVPSPSSTARLDCKVRPLP